MKRYRFRLEPVLRVRRIEQDTARAAMAAAARSLDAAEELLHRSVSRYRTVPLVDGPHDATGWLARRASAERAAAAVVRAGIEREQAAALLDRERDALRDARQRVSALERLDERRREEHALAAQRQEDVDVDELVTGRYGRLR